MVTLPTPSRPLVKSSAPGPGTHWPVWAVAAPAGTCHAAAKAAEMIEAYHVHMSQQRAAAVYPPAVAGPTKSLPVIDGVAPELPLDTEVVGRARPRQSAAGAARPTGTAPGWPTRRSSSGKRKTAGRRSGAGLCSRACCFRRPPWRNNRNCAEANSLDQVRQFPPRQGPGLPGRGGPAPPATRGKRRPRTWPSAPETGRNLRASASASWQNCIESGPQVGARAGAEVDARRSRAADA